MRTFGVVLFAFLAIAAGCGGRGGSRSFLASTAPGATAPVGSSAPLAVPVATAATTSRALPHGAIRALSYNIAALPAFVAFQSTPLTSLPQISPKLNTYDLVLIQENFWYYAELSRDAQHPFKSMPHTGFSQLVGDGLNTFSRSAFTGFTRVTYRACYGVVGNNFDALAAKGFTVGRHELAPGSFVDVYNTHADAGGDPGDQNARADQFKQLAQFMISFSAGRAVILGGDTNLDSKDPPDEKTLQDFMAATGLKDVARTLGRPESIDRFFFRSSTDMVVAPTVWRLAPEFVDAAGKPLSDHEALNVDFEWRKR